MKKKIVVIIVAGGRGTRAGGAEDDLPKQYRSIGSEKMLSITIKQFLKMSAITSVLPIIHKDDVGLFNNLKLEDQKLLKPVFGGEKRQTSVFAGLKEIEKKCPDYVLIHDGARPFVDENVVNGVIKALESEQAVIPAINVIDSIKRSSDGRSIGGSEDRTQLYAAQTPQGFHFGSIFEAHKKAIIISDDFSDDAAIAEWAGIYAILSQGSADNFKITSSDDFTRARRYLAMQEIMETRVGSGYDVHQFEDGEEVILGGVKIPHIKKLKGHSDADTALHVLTDAILGALADGDIGTHFPPSEKKWKGAPSSTFLKFAIDRLKKKNGRIVNLDLTIIAEAPKISPHTKEIRNSIAKICSISIERVSVKATTSEKMGFIGRSEGIATMATATIELPKGE